MSPFYGVLAITIVICVLSLLKLVNVTMIGGVMRFVAFQVF